MVLSLVLSCVLTASLAETRQADAQDATAPAAGELPAAHPGVRLFATPKPRARGAVSEDWPCLYGARRDGVSSETHLSRDWTEQPPKLLWQMDRGNGYACPVIVGDRLVYVHQRGTTTVIECLRPVDGRRWWEYRLDSKYAGEIIANNGPRASAVIADDRVFVHDVDGDLVCLALDDGRKIWHRDLDSEYAVPESFFGVCSTPLAWQDLLIVNVGAGNDGPCVVAFDQKTGKTVWETRALGGASCSSPIAVEHGGRPWAFVFTGGKSRPTVGGVVGLHPRTGKVDFELPWRSRMVYSVNASIPVFADGRLFIMADKGAGAVMIDPGAAAAKASAEGGILWRNRDVALEFVGAVHDDGRLYVFDGEHRFHAGLICVDAATGKEIWRKPIELADQAAAGQASILLVDGAALCLSDEGTLFRLDLKPDGPRLLAQTRLFRAPESWTPPVVHDGLLFVAQNKAHDGVQPRLLCYDLRQPDGD